MRTVTFVLVVSIIALLLLAACGVPELLNPPKNTTDTIPTDTANKTVTEKIIEKGTPTEVVPTPAEPETPEEKPKENETTPQPTPTPTANATTPTTTPTTPTTTLSGCPLISAEDVAGACNKSAVPNVTINGLTCRFHWGEYEVNVTSTAASTGDYNIWAAGIPTAQDGRFKPASTIAEYNKVKYYGWFTGKRLIIATSNNVLGCTLNRLDAVIARVNVDAKIVGEASTSDKLAGAVTDTGKKTLTSVDVMQIMTMKFDKTLPIEGNYSGSIQNSWLSGTYRLMITFKSVPKATYNAYLVKKTTWHVIKLGPLEETSDAYRLTYASTVDLRDHNWVVLTSTKDGKETILSETSLS